MGLFAGGTYEGVLEIVLDDERQRNGI